MEGLESRATGLRLKGASKMGNRGQVEIKIVSLPWVTVIWMTANVADNELTYPRKG